jgi:hypothetical protein
MSLFRRSLGGPVVGVLLWAVLAPLASSHAAAVPDPSVETACVGIPTTTTFTLTQDCDTTTSLTVPDGLTLDGAGYTITAHDPSPGTPFSGAVLTNDPAGTSMAIEDVTVKGTGFEVSCAPLILTGIFFDNAGGSVSDVNVEDITQHSGCPLGLGIRANALAGVARTVTITNTVVSGYQKGALVASGAMTMNVSASTLGPPDPLPAGTISQNGVQYGGTGVKAGAGGTISESTIYGSGYGNSSDQSTAVLLYGAKGVTLSDDTITGAGTDVGVDETADSSGVTVDHNSIGRTAPDVPDSSGIGVFVDAGSSATVSCNRFSGWITDISGVPPQSPCITTSTLPPAEVHTPYSATMEAVGGTAPYTWSVASGSLPPGLTLSPTGTIAGTPTQNGTFSFVIKVTDSLGASATVPQSLEVTVEPDAQGYWLGAGDGGVFAFGEAQFQGSAANLHLAAPITGMASTPTGGYWLVGSDGGVFAFGAPYFGSLAGQPLGTSIVGIAGTPEGDGYYLVGADGSVFPFGAALFRGSMQGDPLNAPVVGMAVTADNQGYYLVASDGGVFAFGDARFQGSMGGQQINRPIVGVAVDDATSGYWLVAADGGIFSFGAPFLGSTGAMSLNAPIVGMASTLDDLGYRLVAADGGVFSYGTAQFLGSMGGSHLDAGVVSTAPIG